MAQGQGVSSVACTWRSRNGSSFFVLPVDRIQHVQHPTMNDYSLVTGNSTSRQQMCKHTYRDPEVLTERGAHTHTHTHTDGRGARRFHPELDVIGVSAVLHDP